ncbi:hypothetical protein R1sor_019689 [Riccia sorocarpa]|uniref:Uncharacterized protein n=1 Tax=Riccia sorocarpa TaxID=122646 RepID=A0ABD3IHJ7_9MARC
MTALRQLLLQNNQLNGSIPDCLRNMTKLDELNLANNRLEGEFPSNLFATLRNLQKVDLGNNIITGSIPDDLVDIPTLQVLSLRSNNLSGPISPLLALSPCDHVEEPLPGSAIPPHPVHRRSSNSLSILTIVALTAGDIAPLLMSGAGFVFFISWWKKRSKNNKDDENEDKSANCSLRSVYGKELGQAADPHRPTYLVPAPALKPALKSVLGKVNDDDQDTEKAAENDFALSCEEFGMDHVILDRRLVLDIESLLRANANTKLRHNEVGINNKMTNQSKSNQSKSLSKQNRSMRGMLNARTGGT